MDLNKTAKKWQEKWEKSKIFEVKEKAKKFYVLEMFPYPSGEGLHMGHAFNYTIGDIFARFKRMNGFNVLYPMGYDSLGLPAENAAIEAKQHPKDYTEKSIKNFIKQQKALGLSYDWNRMVVTSDPSYYKWDQWIFLKMFEKGLAFRKKAPVNWCSKCNSVLANEQVHDGKCWRHKDTHVEIKQLEQWFFKITDYADELYEGIDKLNWSNDVKAMQKHWIGKSHGTEINFKINGKDWPIFTTRPDTVFGVTFMVVSAQHPRLNELVTKEQKKEVEAFVSKIKSTSEKDMEELEKEGAFTGSYAVNPVNNEKIPVYTGNFVLAEYGSGMVMAVPAHDQRDFEFAKKYKIPIKEVIRNSLLGAIAGANKNIEAEFKRLDVKYKLKDNVYFIKSTSDKREPIFSLIQRHMDKNYYSDVWINGEVFAIFKNKVYNISKNNLKKAQEEANKLNLPKEFSNLSKVKDDWKDFINDKTWEMELEKAYVDEGVLVNSKEFNGLYSNDAIDKITKHLEKNKKGKKVIQFKLRDWLISRQRYWGTPIPIIYCSKCGLVPDKNLPIELPEKVEFGKGNPLATNKEFVNVKCPKCKGNAKRETDTMDTFVNSSWYFLRYTDANNNKEIFDKKKASYWMPVDLYIGGKEHACMHLIYFRFYNKFLRDLGLIKNNEPAPNLFNQGMLHGIDGHVMSKSRGNIVLPEEISKKYGIDTARLFLVSMASPDRDVVWSDKGIESTSKLINKITSLFDKKKADSDKKLKNKIHRTIREVTRNIETLQYNKAAIALSNYIDYLHSEKVSNEALETLTLLLAPFTPHLSEELWEKLGKKPFISLTKWPKFEEKYIDDEIEYLESLSCNVISDINAILELIKITPKQIKLIVSEKWKYDYCKKLKDILKKTFDANAVLKQIMSTDLKKHGQDISKLTPNIVKDPAKLPLVVTNQEKEAKTLEENKKVLEEQFKTKIIIEKAENSKEEKAKQAFPGRPAIVIN